MAVVLVVVGSLLRSVRDGTVLNPSSHEFCHRQVEVTRSKVVVRVRVSRFGNDDVARLHAFLGASGSINASRKNLMELLAENIKRTIDRVDVSIADDFAEDIREQLPRLVFVIVELVDSGVEASAEILCFIGVEAEFGEVAVDSSADLVVVEGRRVGRNEISPVEVVLAGDVGTDHVSKPCMERTPRGEKEGKDHVRRMTCEVSELLLDALATAKTVLRTERTYNFHRRATEPIELVKRKRQREKRTCVLYRSVPPT